MAPWGDQVMPRFSRWYHLEGEEKLVTNPDFWEVSCEALSQPTRDESPFGVQRTAGTVLEWCVGRPHTLFSFVRAWRGGFPGGPDVRLAPRNDGFPDRPGRNDSFRLVAWRKPAHR
jgi:hypothetical protein